MPVAHNQGADRSGSGESLDSFLMSLPSVFPQGKIRITGDGRDAESNFPDMVSSVSPVGKIEITGNR